MFKYRVPLFILIAFGIAFTTWILIQIGEGYRPNIQEGTITATGLLSVDSQPQGAQVYINGELTTATDDTLSLKPTEYDVEIKKDAFLPWKKHLTIEAGLVTQTQSILFPLAPDLKAITYSGVQNTTLAPNGTKIVYSIPPESTTSASKNVNAATSKDGLWLLDLVDLPLGFSRDPRQLVVGQPRNFDWENAQLQWSPDSRQLLALFTADDSSQSATLTTPKTKSPSPTPTPIATKYIAAFLINTTQSSVVATTLTNQISNLTVLQSTWNTEQQDRDVQQLQSLAPKFSQLMATAAASLDFSPDESKLMYIATASADLQPNYVPALLAASTQQQSRTIQPNNLYVYDIKEDRNFLIQENYQPQSPSDKKTDVNNNPQTADYNWFPTSRHLIKTETNQITILEYDNTNHATIYSGPLQGLNVYPHPSGDKLYILTSLNPVLAPLPNLYALILQ